MPHAHFVDRTGTSEVLQWREYVPQPPGSDEVQIRHRAIGVNYIDIYHRSGLYPVADSPFCPGMEAAGIIEAVGADVRGLSAGDRVAYASPPLGAYCEVRNFPAARCVRIPAGIDDDFAAAGLLKGMTAEYLLHRAAPVEAGDTILVHAAAGGVGQLLCQWASAMGVRVIGTCGSDAKADLAKSHGCSDVIVYTRDDFVARCMNLTGGRGVDVVYDSVGATTAKGSLACLRPRGMLVNFGQSSGTPASLDMGLLGRKSLFVTRPSLMTYVDTREELEASSQDWFSVLRQGIVRMSSPTVYPLAEARRAHDDLEARRTTGSLILKP